MSDMTNGYLTQLRRRDRDELDAYMEQRLAALRPKPSSSSSPAPEMGLGEEFTRGVVRGGSNVLGSVGTLLKAGGALTGSNMLASAGEQIATYWSEVASENAPSAKAQGNLWDDPWLVLNPHWLTASVAETLPSLAATLVPAGGAGTAINVGGKLIGWSPAVALKLARIGAAVTGGAVGGSLEGASTYEEVKRRGGSDEDALQAMAFMGLASAGLNAISLGQAFKTAARPGLLPLAKRAGIAGASEGLTEWLEEPTEAVILGEDWNGVMEAAKRGLNVIPAAALTGGAANVGLGAAKGAKGAAPALASQEGAARLGGEEGKGKSTGPKAGDTLTVNLKYIDGTKEFKSLTAAINEENAARMAEDRKTRGVNEMREAGRRRLPNLEAALEWEPTNAPAEELQGGLRALADWRDSATRHFETLLKDAVTKQPPIVRFRSEAAAIEHTLPPVQSGSIRLFRGEGTTSVALPEWAKTNAGQWFTTNRAKAEAFQKERGGRLRSVDIPLSELGQYQAPAGNAPDEYLIPDIVQRNRGAGEVTDPNAAKWNAYRAFTLAGELAAKVERGESIIGRAMRMQQEVSTGTTAFDAAELMQVADSLRDTSDINIDAFVARMQALRTRGQRRLVAKQSVNLMRSGQNALYEAWINGLLSGPQTLAAVNPISNTMTMLWAIPERALAAQFHVGTEPGVVKGEATAMLRGMVEGFMDGLRIARLAWTDFETGGSAGGFLNATKLDLPRHAITAGAFDADPAGSVGRALDLLGSGIRMPSRFMASTDAFFKAVNYRMELKALALRDAMAEGLDGDALVRRVAQIELNPPAAVKERAEQFMLLQTFQNDLGETGQAMLRLRDASGVGRLIVPFIKTPTNIAKWVVYRTPGLNALSSQFRADLSAPGPARDLALAKASLGVMVAASVAALAGAGLVTGGGPSDPDLKRNLRNTGWQPYSLKIGDTYYSYNRLDPLGALIGLVADTSEIIGQVPSVQADTMAAAVVLALTNTMVNKTYMQGLSNAIEAISNPERGATQYAASIARTLIPTAIRTVARTVDPTVREARGILDSIKAGVPGWSEDLPPRRNLFGDPILLGGGLGPDLISPVYASTIKDDAVSAELVKHRVDISMPSRVLEGRRPGGVRDRGLEGVELSPQEYDRYVRTAADGLKAELASLIASPGYTSQSNGPDGGKALLLRHTIYSFRQAARARLIGEDPAIQQRHIDFIERRATALAPTLGR